MTDNIVKLERRRPLVTLVDSPSTINLMREEILRSKLFYRQIATKAQLSPTTVGNIASGSTKLPRLETTIRLLSALGWSIIAQRSAA